MTSEIPVPVIVMLSPKPPITHHPSPGPRLVWCGIPPTTPGAGPGKEPCGRESLASAGSVSTKRLKLSLSMSLKTSLLAARICFTSSLASELRTAATNASRSAAGRLTSSAAPCLTKWLTSSAAPTLLDDPPACVAPFASSVEEGRGALVEAKVLDGVLILEERRKPAEELLVLQHVAQGQIVAGTTTWLDVHSRFRIATARTNPERTPRRALSHGQFVAVSRQSVAESRQSAAMSRSGIPVSCGYLFAQHHNLLEGSVNHHPHRTRLRSYHRIDDDLI